MAKIAMFVFNDGQSDLRVHRQARLLGSRGHQVRVYCFLEPGLPQREPREGFEIRREDQRSGLARFVDDRLLARFKKPRQRKAPLVSQLSTPADRPPERPCRRPTRALKVEDSPGAADHRAYISRINQVWAEKVISWGPDLVESHDLDTLEAGVAVKKALGCPLIYDTHELWSEQPFIDSVPAVTYWEGLERKLICAADQVMTVNEPLAEELQDHYALESVVALHNCQELSEPDAGRRNRLRQQAGDRPVALYQGAYAPDRGLEQMIASTAFQDKVVVAFRGFGSEEAGLKAMEGAERVLFLPPVPADDIVTAASEADIGLIPFLPTCLNHYLSTPNKLFEYMMAGVPMAGSDLPELQKFVADLELGVLFDPYSPRDIARALCELTDLETKGQKARQLAVERYHWEREGEKLLEVVDRLLKT